ncbi:dATP/dGTP diphosphohydrolase domain-containing protein [Motiliproteus coralliicola]|uniref:dATP/dGTP diphosphohydrolase domain-containing protein n=1 Tax=Motiliproteus coralliicola TaxID=2283196 RepID=UPI003C762B4B
MPSYQPLQPENDPTGRGQHEPGAKVDAGKTRLDLVLGAFANALMGVGEVGTFGARKYTDDGWLSVPNGKARYSDALLRHYFKEQRGEIIDSDSRLHHDLHLAWNALARVELRIREEQEAMTALQASLPEPQPVPST